MNSERAVVAIALAAWLAGGAGLEFLETGQAPARAAEPVERSLFGLMGSGRTLAADWFWLEANLAWERHDATETRRLIALSVAADPASQYYWLNGARMLAYDLPAWRDDAEAPAAVRRRKCELAAEEACRLLESGMAYHGRCVAFEIEMANIWLYALGDSARAAEYYERAATRPDAPAYASRIAAQLREEIRR